METNVNKELEKSIMSNDMFGFRKELVNKFSSRIMSMSQEELLPVFQKAAKRNGIELESHTETGYDDGIDFSSSIQSFKSQVIKSCVDDIIYFISKKRDAIRYRYKKTVDVFPEETLADGPLIARTNNISASGMLIRSRTPFKKGEKLELKVRSKGEDEPVCFVGSVVRSNQMKQSGFDVGVLINSISELDEDSNRVTAAEAVYRLSHMGYKGRLG